MPSHRLTVPLATLWLAAVPACGPAQAPPPAAPRAAKPAVAGPFTPVRLHVTLRSASVAGSKADGTSWDGKEGQKPWVRDNGGPLAKYVTAHPELDGAEKMLGIPIERPDAAVTASKSEAPDPMVIVEAAGTVYRSPMRAGQFNPVWDFPFVATLTPVPGAIVKITVVDWDGPGHFDVMGETLVQVIDLVKGDALTVPAFGDVETLALGVERQDASERSHRVSVPGKATWTETGITVVAGQEVIILATGEVCSKGKDRGYCAGPEGQLKPSSGYNLPGFEQRGHAILIGSIGDTRFTVGRELRFVAPSSGALVLGVNDKDPSDNSGELEASVTIR